ncbi:hypothetical protein BDR22DRAFT_966612 [Usnea florida]
MAPFLTLVADGFPNSSFPHAPQPKNIVSSTSNQNQWGPDSISTTVFGFVMFFMGLVALWQGRARRRRHEQDEEGRCGEIGGRPITVANVSEMVDFSQGLEIGRVAVAMDQHPCDDDDDGDATDQGFVQIGRGMRTDTEGTLVGRDDDGSEEKEMED